MDKGDLYGTTSGGGVPCPAGEQRQCGTVFKITRTGTLTTLYTFCAQTDCIDGISPAGALVQASDGNFYGTTLAGGSSNHGAIFRMTPAGVLTTFYSFSGGDEGPTSGLIQASDGALYGTTADPGSVFRIKLDGSFQSLYNFCSQPNCTDGFLAYAGLIEGTDGNLYGTTSGGGVNGWGNIFRITTAGAFTNLYSFCSDCRNGVAPYGPLFQAPDGNFYGTTFGSSSGTGSVVYRLSTGLGPFVAALPTQGRSRQRVTILGNGLSGATAVTFNGTPAKSFTVNSTGSAIATAVPEGAASGPIQVTLADGSKLSSNPPFRVRQR